MSGIYINGVKMPVGEDEGILIAIYDGKAHEIGTKKTLDAIELPPHGRLIDADALLSLLDKCMFPSDMVTTSAVRMATNWIKEAPTVIEADGGYSEQELQNDYEKSVEMAEYCEKYEQTYDPDTGAM